MSLLSHSRSQQIGYDARYGGTPRPVTTRRDERGRLLLDDRSAPLADAAYELAPSFLATDSSWSAITANAWHVEDPEFLSE